METIWKKIPGFSRYDVSSDGFLRSNNYKNSGKTKTLKPAWGPDGYSQTMLQDDKGEYHSSKIHSIVCLTFFGPRERGQEVNHKDGNKANNSIDNLEYCTRKENVQHAFDMGLIKPKVGSLNGMAKLTENQVREIRETAKRNGRYYGRKILAKKYGVCECTIKEIVTRRRNKFYSADTDRHCGVGVHNRRDCL